MFDNIDSYTQGVDFTFNLILYVSIFSLGLITFLMIYFCVKYHHTKNKVALNVEGNVPLEVAWTVLPTIIVMVFFYYGYEGFLFAKNPPKDSTVVEATASKWNWSFKYESGKIIDTLVVEKDKPVRVNIKSADVTHSLYIPEYRVKMDAQPGYNNYVWFYPTKEGTYKLYCAEYCGLDHWNMIKDVVVKPKKQYQAWYKAKSAASPGEVIYATKCNSCHSLDGKKGIGPTFKGLLGRKENVVTGGATREITVDEDYIANSIKDPGADLREGFSNIMPNLGLTDSEIKDVVDYLKTIK